MDIGTAALPVEIADEDENDDVFILEPLATSKRGAHIQNPISVDDDYSDYKINLQRAIIASLSSPLSHIKSEKTVIDLSAIVNDDDDDDDVVQIVHLPCFPPRKRRNRFGSGISIREPGESSSSNSGKPSNNPSPDSNCRETFLCEICVEPKPYAESFAIRGCVHYYCTDCMIKYVASKLQDNITQIRCPVPDCKGLLEPDQCRPILPQEVFDRWGNALCEALILGTEKFYCPFKDCSALLIDDRIGGEVITQSECPDCRRLFCAHCKVAWHAGIDCSEYQKLNKDERGREDIMLMNLAKNKNWRRCSQCRFYVERIAGCKFMRCRCGYNFCYHCGNHLKDHKIHYCKKFKR